MIGFDSEGRRYLGLRVGLVGIGIALLMVGCMCIFVLRGGQLPVGLLVIPGSFFLIGVTMIVSDSIESALNIKDELERFAGLVEDDIAELKQGRFTRGTFTLVLTILVGLFAAYQVLVYEEWSSFWWIIPVSVVALTASIIALIFGLSSDWFQDRSFRSSKWVYVIPTVGLFLCMALGIIFQEPVEVGGPTVAEMQAGQTTGVPVQRTYQTRGSTIFVFQNNYVSGGNVHLPSNCTGKCAEGMVIVVVIIIVIICICSSAMVPHAWFVAVVLLWTIMLMYSMRELLFIEGRRWRNR